MKKTITMLLCLLTVSLSFLACTKSVIPSVDNTVSGIVETVDSEESIVGSWVACVDMADMINESVENEGFLDSFIFQYKLDVTDTALTLSGAVDPASVDAFGDAMIAYAREMMGDELAGEISDEEFAGMIDLEALKKELVDEVGALKETTTAYQIKGDRIYSVENGEIDENDYVVFACKDGKLYLNEFADGNMLDGELVSMLPLVFERA